MQVRHFAEEPIQGRVNYHRVGDFKSKELGVGTPGTPGNYSLRMVYTGPDFYSPRHAHNFDQVRVQISGVFPFDKDGTMKPGTIGYFPEGTAYGPQTSQEAGMTLVLQIGGASGGGFLSDRERDDAVVELMKKGRFVDGRYHAEGEAEGDGGVDGFQAIWEQARGRQMKYPGRRLQKPVLAMPQAVAWRAVPGCPGVDAKRVFNFGSSTVAVDQYRLAAGASLQLNGPSSSFVEQGSGELQSGDATAALASYDAINLGAGESAVVTATAEAGAELTVIAHPVFD
jgi:hypothetical protein